MSAPQSIPSKLFSLRFLALLLQKCMKAKALRQGKQIHAISFTSGIQMRSQSLNPNLVGVYASCGNESLARLVFQETLKPTAFAYNWMILASAFHGYYVEAIRYFSLMRRESTYSPNKYTLSMVLKACVGLMDLQKGKEVHAIVNLLGFESDTAVGSALIDMYCKCRRVDHARQLFNRMIKKDVVSWTSMICGYLKIDNIEESISLFERMKLDGLQPNEFTWNAMIACYAWRGDRKGTFEVYHRMTKEGIAPDLITWNAIISGFAQSDQPIEALSLLKEMLGAGFTPNQVTVTAVLSACAGLIDKGKEIHCVIYRLGIPQNVFVATALTEMYSQCGSIKDALNVFCCVPHKNVPLWNSMIGCYGKHGMGGSAIKLFEKMQKEGFQPNQITLTSVLSACSHSGLVGEGLKIFNSMKESLGVEATKEHYACVVDLMCRSGRLLEAYELVKGMPIEVTDSIVGAFFNGCRLHGRSDLAKMMADDIFRMELKRPAGFVALSNIFAATGEWQDVEDVRKVMMMKGIHKMPGFSGVGKGDDECAAIIIGEEGNIVETAEARC